MYLNHELRFAFIHIPKTAGTSVIRAIAGESVVIDHGLSGAEEADEYLRACFVRHPVERFVSAYRYSSQLAFRRDGKYLSEKHPVRSFIADEDIHDINTFVAAVASLGSVWLFNNIHFRPQAHWVSQANPQFIGRHERLDDDFSTLCSLIGVETMPLGRHRVSRGKTAAPLGEAETEIVRAWYRDDFELLNY
jgi:hypothetical protein